MLRKLLLSLVFCIASLSAFAADVVKWVDENGITHFGNAQFAPAGAGERVALKPANSMDAPDTRILSRSTNAKPMNIVTVEKHQTKNPRGWRGYSGRRVAGNARRARIRR